MKPYSYKSYNIMFHTYKTAPHLSVLELDGYCLRWQVLLNLAFNLRVQTFFKWHQNKVYLHAIQVCPNPSVPQSKCAPIQLNLQPASTDIFQMASNQSLLICNPSVPQSKCVPITVCPNPSVLQSKCAPIQVGPNPSGPQSKCVPIQVGPNPSVPQSKCAPIQACPNPSVPQSKCVPVQVCPNPSVPQSKFAPMGNLPYCQHCC